jgi:O-antigen/teichoic acid export membrane protein
LTVGTRYQLVVATPLVVTLAWYSTDLVTLWLGPDFAPAGPLLAILAGSVMFAAIQMNPANVLGMGGRHRTVAAVMVVCAAVNVALSVALIVAAGLPGVAIATLVSVATVQTAMLVPAACRQVGVPLPAFLRDVLWPLLPPLLPALVALALLDRLGPPASLAGLAARSAAAAFLFLFTFACTGTTPGERLRAYGALNRIASALQLRPSTR